MAKHLFTFQDPKAGDIVYQAYKPQNPAKVRLVSPDRNNISFDLDVIDIGGRVHLWKALHVNCFRTLVEDHRRKATNHGAVLKVAEAL